MSWMRRNGLTVARLVTISTIANACAALLIFGAATRFRGDFRDPYSPGALALYLLCAIAMLGASLLSARWVARAISAPLAELAQAVERMRHGEPPTPHCADVPAELRALSSALSLAFEERQAALQKVQTLAHFDGVTGALSRAYFDHRARNLLQILMRENQAATLLYIDLDRFKEVNDHHGHDAGDLLLRGVVDRARQRLRSIDIIGRRGGDEFVVFLPNMVEPDAIAALARDLAALITAPLDVGENTVVQVGVSMGAASFPDQAASYDALVTCADRAMYEAKKAGGGRLGAASGEIIAVSKVARVSP